ncbi:MAG TPA: hypothetical protein VGE72_19000 [Azospirillum sp.]
MHDLFFHPAFGMVLFNLLILWPLWRTLRRAGLSPWWSLLVVVPMVGFMAVIAVLAHARWPNLPDRARPRPPKTRRTA